MLTVRTTPIRTSPVRTATFDRSFDRAFDQLVGSFFERRPAGPVVDAAWQGDTYVLTVDLPGVPASNVAVEVSGTLLTLSAVTDHAGQHTEWRRSVRLGGRLDPEKVEASHVDGRLTVRIGSFDAPTARKVEIATTPLTQLDVPAEQPAIDATATDDRAGDDQSSDTNVAG
jgi:HSP20 family protein